MQPADSGQVRAEINVTPLVDVVLVLLIIFMVIMPILHAAPPVQLPTTEEPPRTSDDAAQLLITLDHQGAVWIEDRKFDTRTFGPELSRVARRYGGRDVLLMGDARLSFGEVRRVMQVLEDSGLSRVGLITDRRGAHRR